MEDRWAIPMQWMRIVLACLLALITTGAICFSFVFHQLAVSMDNHHRTQRMLQDIERAQSRTEGGKTRLKPKTAEP